MRKPQHLLTAVELSLCMPVCIKSLLYSLVPMSENILENLKGYKTGVLEPVLAGKETEELTAWACGNAEYLRWRGC